MPELEFVRDAFLTEIMVDAIVFFGVMPLYTIAYVAPEWILDLSPESIERGFNIPWKPFEYMSFILGNVPRLAQEYADILWKDIVAQ